MGAVYTTLDRLEQKGLIESDLERRSEVDGRERRYYAVRPAGRMAWAETRSIRESMWRGLSIAPTKGTES